MRNGVTIADLQSLPIDEAAALLDLIKATARDDRKELQKFLRSPNGQKMPLAVDPFQVGNLY